MKNTLDQIKILTDRHVYGFYYYWHHEDDANGNPVPVYKVLQAYQGSEMDQPTYFVESSKEIYEKVLKMEGKIYLGIDEPKLEDFA